MRHVRILATVVLSVLLVAIALETGLSYCRGTILEYHKPNVFFACTYTGDGILGLQIQTHVPVLGNKPGWNAVTLPRASSPDVGGTRQWFDSLPGPRLCPVRIGFSPFGGTGLQFAVRGWLLLVIIGVPLALLIRWSVKRRRQRGFEVQTSPATSSSAQLGTP